MVFSPFVIHAETGEQIPVAIESATEEQLKQTKRAPRWQTDWTSDYLSDVSVEKYAVASLDGELIGLGAYQIRGNKAYVLILYAESAPHSNPTMHPRGARKYYGIGELLIAFGIKYSIDHGCRGDVVFEAKTDELARHYEQDFHACRIPSVSSGPMRYMLADEDAWNLFSGFLKEDDEQ